MMTVDYRMFLLIIVVGICLMLFLGQIAFFPDGSYEEHNMPK